MSFLDRRTLLFGLAAILLVAAAVTFLRGRSDTALPPALITTTGTVADGAGGVAPAQEEPLVVDVAGAVRRPGLYRLPQGSRVADAVAKAGGITSKADRLAVNLAALLVDGEQVLIPESPPVGGGAGGVAPDTSAGGELVHLNSADAAALDALPGVGPATAQRIVDWRTANGGFRTVDDLLEVPGIGPAKLEQLRSLVAP